MKKLLVLALVLSLSSMASATMVLTVNGQTAGREITLEPSDIITLGMSSDIGGTPAFGLYYIDVLKAEKPFYTLSNVHMMAAAGDKGAVIGPYTFDVYDEYEITVASTTGQNAPGSQVEGTFHCDGIGNVNIVLWDAAGNILDELTIIQVPEPATIAMLGLGGLALLRRRK